MLYQYCCEPVKLSKAVDFIGRRSDKSSGIFNTLHQLIVNSVRSDRSFGVLYTVKCRQHVGPMYPVSAVILNK